MVYARASVERSQINGTTQILILAAVSIIMAFLNDFLVYDIYLLILYCLHVFSLIYNRAYCELLTFTCIRKGIA